MRDIYCNGYLGGNGRRSWDPLDENHVQSFASGDNIGLASIFWAFVPQKKDMHWWMSSTGQMPESMPATQSVRDMMEREGARAFANFWGMATNGRTNYLGNGPSSTVNNPNDRRFNVICIQDFQQTYDPTTKQYSVTTLNRGHWGASSCYPGAAEVTSGHSPQFAIPDYLSIRVTAIAA